MNVSNGQNKGKGLYLGLAFLVPCMGMLVYMMITKCMPFGNYSMLYSDMYHQYYPFFKAYREALLSGDSLLYTWDVGMGMDHLGLIAYYLASPLYLLSVLVPESLTLEFFSLLMPVKLGLAGLFFAIFLRGISEKNDLSITLFGSFYALCAWALGYQWNIMWLDSFALLPLVVLGTVSLLKDRKFILYTLTLAISIWSNYYIGFFVCIFVGLVFICWQICRWQGFKRFFVDLGLMAAFSALAICMTAMLELPAFAALQTTQSSVNAFPEGFRLNIAKENTWRGLFDAMRQVAGNTAGGLVPTWKEGLPNLYCGVGTMMLAMLYLMAKEIRIRDKICAVALLLLFNVSFIIRQLDYIWHGFHFTNMIPYRFSFLHSFVLLYMGYQAWLRRREFRIWQLVVAALLSASIFLCSDLRDQRAFLVWNMGFLAAYLFVMVCGQIRVPRSADPRREEQELRARAIRRAWSAVAMMAVLTVELILNLVNFGTNFSRTNVTYYPKGTEYTASMIRYMKEREEDTLFYRAEVTHSQTLNDGALNSYDGISTFTSSANVQVTGFMKNLGYGAKNTYNRYCWEEASPVSNLYLGLKYMLDRDGKDKESEVFDFVHQYGSTALYANAAYLPLGFLAEKELKDVTYSLSGNGFLYQNELFAATTGVAEPVWRRLLGDSLTIEGQGVNIKDQNSSGYCIYGDAESGSHVIYRYVADQDGFMCVDLNLPKRNGVIISVNGFELYAETTSLPQMLAVGDVQVGDVIEVVMSCQAGESGTMTLNAAILNMERFWKGYDRLAKCTLELTSFSNTRVAGTIDCDRDGLLYTSIPQNGNWTAYVDGEPAEICLVGDVMVAVELTEGTHHVEFRYENPAFSLGWKISLASLAVFVLLVVLVYKPAIHVQKGKFER